MKKRMLSILLVVAVMLQMCIIPASAAGNIVDTAFDNIAEPADPTNFEGVIVEYEKMTTGASNGALNGNKLFKLKVYATSTWAGMGFTYILNTDAFSLANRNTGAPVTSGKLWYDSGKAPIPAAVADYYKNSVSEDGTGPDAGDLVEFVGAEYSPTTFTPLLNGMHEGEVSMTIPRNSDLEVLTRWCNSTTMQNSEFVMTPGVDEPLHVFSEYLVIKDGSGLDYNDITPELLFKSFVASKITSQASGATGINIVDGKFVTHFKNFPSPAKAPSNVTVEANPAKIVKGDSTTITASADALSEGGTLSYALYSNTTDTTTGGILVKNFQAENTFTVSPTADTYYYVTAKNTKVYDGETTTAEATSAATAKVVVRDAIAAPTDVTAEATGTTTASISWKAPAAGGVDYYELAGDNGFKAITTSGITADLKGLTKGTTYHFTVQSFTNVGMSKAIAASPITTWDVPGAPTGLSVTQSGSGALRYSWAAPANIGGTKLTGYTLTVTNAENQGIEGSPFALAASETSKEIKGLTLGTVYKATVAAKNSVGAGTAAAFEEKEAADVISAAEPVISKDVTTEAIDAAYGDIVTLSVEATAENRGGSVLTYQWYETTGKTETGTPITGATKSTYKGKAEQGGTHYYYCVVTNTDTLSNVDTTLRGEKTAVKKSAVATVVVKSDRPGAPKLSYEGSDKTIELSWNEPVDGGSPITGYKLTVAEDEMFNKILTDYNGKELEASAKSTIIEGLDNAKTYYIKLTATNSVGAGTAGTITAQPYSGAYVEIKTEEEVASGSALVGKVELSYANGAPIKDATKIPANRLVVLRAIPEEGYVFSKWVRTNLTAPAGSLEIGESFSFDQADSSTDNPLTVKASVSSEYVAQFAVKDGYAEDTYQITDLWASQTSGAAFDRARELSLMKKGIYGDFGFDSMTKAYDLYLLKTDGTALDFTMTAATGSAITVSSISADGTSTAGVSVTLTEVPKDTQNKQLARGSYTLPAGVKDGDVLTIEAVSPDGKETVSYTVTIHLSTADPKVALEVVQFQGSEKATLKVKMSEGYFNANEFMVHIKDNSVIEGFTDKNYNVFTGTMDDEKVNMTESHTDQQTNMDRFLNVTSVRSDGTDLAARFESAVEGGAANLTSESAIIAEFYLKIKPNQSMTDIVNALTVYNVGETKENNTMRDLRYGKLSGTEAGDKELDLVYLEEAEFYYITGKINSELTGDATTRITFDVFNKVGTLINDAGEVTVKPDGILEYRVPEDDYQFVIRAGGYLSTTKNLKVQKDLILSTLPLYAGNLNSDEVIDGNDRLLFLNVYHMEAVDGGVENEIGDIIYADFDGSDYVNAYDLGILLGNYGKAPVVR